VSGTPSTAFFISSSRFNVRQDGTITGSNVLFNGGKVGGFTIDSSKITGTNIIIDSAGSIQTANYASDLLGWKIDASGNGTAEFENVKIRGTLSTAVFEKQSVLDQLKQVLVQLDNIQQLKLQCLLKMLQDSK
jgi:osmotically-inducible protein OsmY